MQDWNTRLRPFLRTRGLVGWGPCWSHRTPCHAGPACRQGTWTDPSPLPSSEVHSRQTWARQGHRPFWVRRSPAVGPPLLGLVAFPKEEGSGQRLLHIPQVGAGVVRTAHVGGGRPSRGVEPTHLRVLVAVEAFPDLVLVHVTEGNHLGGRTGHQPQGRETGPGGPRGPSCCAGGRRAGLAATLRRASAVRLR